MTRLAALAGAVAMTLLSAAAGAQARTESAASTAAPQAAPSTVPSTAADRRAQAKNDRAQPVTVDADKMERFGKEALVVFTGNVIARQNNSVQYADRMEVYLDERGDKILRTVSTGSVRIITRDCRTGTARRAEYHDLDQRVVLLGNARVWQEDNVVSGETITIFLSQDRSVVQGGKQERVKAVFYQKDEKPKDEKAKDAQTTQTTASARSAPATCEN
jgi:lipopolysaccharide export system protein LptA